MFSGFNIPWFSLVNTDSLPGVVNNEYNKFDHYVEDEMIAKM